MSTLPPTHTKPPHAPSGMEHDALPPGTRFGEFEILRVVGVGGFGIVYLAQDHSLEREVALKEYMPASLAARGHGPQITVRSSSFAETYAIGLRSFVNEARLLARFDHPSLVKVYRFWEDNATAYMVMPFLQGVTLRDTRRGMAHPPDEAWIRSVITPILSALELLHREGVYHRDIAPDNILLPPDGPPVLLDFGAARRVISDRTQSLTAILKPSYAPIEQYAEMAQMRQGPWTDLYALGAVVHYLLFGAPPAPATARAVQDDAELIENRIVPGVSPRFLEAVAWMLSIRPNQRPQNGEQLRAVLDGRAEIPPRGRPGITIPGAVAPAMPAAAFEPTRHVEHSPATSRVATSYVPTHFPTAQMAPSADLHGTAVKPAAQVPPPPVPPSQIDAVATTRTTAPAPRPNPPPVTLPPRSATLPPPVPSVARPPVTQAPVVPVPRTQPAPLVPAATRAVPPPVAAISAAAPPAVAKSSRPGLFAAVAVALVALVVAVVAWQSSVRRDATAAVASGGASSAAMPATAGTPPAPIEPQVAPTVPVGATAAAVAPVGPLASSPFSPQPLPTSAAPPTSPSPHVAESTSVAARAGSSAAHTAASPGVDPRPGDHLLDRTAQASAVAASNARARAARPVPGSASGDAATAGAALAPARSLEAQPVPGNPSYGSAAALAERARAATASREAAMRSVPAAVEVVPTSASEACGKRVFISRAICMDEKCEEPRFRNTQECIGILARKTARENR
ncbi:MAG: protein kinase [Caldimonas sp.]